MYVRIEKREKREVQCNKLRFRLLCASALCSGRDCQLTCINLQWWQTHWRYEMHQCVLFTGNNGEMYMRSRWMRKSEIPGANSVRFTAKVFEFSIHIFPEELVRKKWHKRKVNEYVFEPSAFEKYLWHFDNEFADALLWRECGRPSTNWTMDMQK